MKDERSLWERVIDRELLLSAFSHDVRGPVTALSGYAELEGVPERSPLRLVPRLRDHDWLICG
ncbi:hypothetical protein LBMAG42_45260 [Deltaproteobacteria bacterium]|nr:hypothetical protein LBMAG42_45260 [Deltaproteobacteria bacterium]